MSEQTPDAPIIEVVSGSPTAEELAAVVTVLTAAAGTATSRGERSDRASGSGWNAYWRSVRREHRPGPGAWRGR